VDSIVRAGCSAVVEGIVLDDERATFGSGYDTSHSKLMRFEDGRRLHADTVTWRFNRRNLRPRGYEAAGHDLAYRWSDHIFQPGSPLGSAEQLHPCSPVPFRPPVVAG
jgi:hypothetical protein